MEKSPIFWNTQGGIIYDTEKNYFNYETSMSVNWSNKLARRVLITIMKLFGRPEILDVKKSGIAIWTENNLKNSIFYKLPIIFNEISIRDEYVVDEKGLYNAKYSFLTVSYKCKLDEKYIKNLGAYHNYVTYDSEKYVLNVKSRTLEENIVIISIFLGDNKLTTKNIPITIKRQMKELNAKEPQGFLDHLKAEIANINSKTNITDIPVAKQNNNVGDFIEEEANFLSE